MLRAAAKTEFGAGNFRAACSLYQQALESLDGGKESAVQLHTNMALSHWRLGEAQDALRHADSALALDPRHEKALFRRAAALQKLERPVEAREALCMVLAIYPRNAEAGRLLEEIDRRASAASGAEARSSEGPTRRASKAANANFKDGVARALAAGGLYDDKPTTAPAIGASHTSGGAFAWLSGLWPACCSCCRRTKAR